MARARRRHVKRTGSEPVWQLLRRCAENPAPVRRPSQRPPRARDIVIFRDGVPHAFTWPRVDLDGRPR